MLKRILSLLLCALLLLSLPFAVYADEEVILPLITTLEIASADDFLTFAENCRLDSYSQNLVVELTSDISLEGQAFQSIPIFCGVFRGNGHTISGLELTAEGSVQGLFRYLTPTALVENLQVQGNIHPQGTMDAVGGIAGSNEGLIRNCSFTGTVSGGDYVGGIVGKNEITGTVELCQSYGDIHGDHFIGGIAGTNLGVLRYCYNNMTVNTTPQQNSIALDQITMETLTESETAGTVTNIGGIAGHSDGVIRGCVNYSDVGYKHMGYNIGGIAGSHMGYIVNCANYAAVSGRKEVGGIVGQAEPAVHILYAEDTLQQLQVQLDDLSALTKQASAHAQGNSASIVSQIGSIQDKTQSALDALEQLIPEGDNPQLPDPDSITAAQNALSSALSGIQGSLGGIISSVQGTVGTLQSDMQAISQQIEAMGQTINNASEDMGGSVEDVSDLDTEADITAKVANCYNYAPILADLNAGGIAGALALENDFDPEDDVDIFGEYSLNFAGQLRAVILRCHNEGEVTCGKQNAGGIVGWMSLGLAKECVNTGAVSAENASYVGGVAGQSRGFIRSCSVKCSIAGEANVGGIAGTAKVLSDCRSMTILSATEKAGAVLGFADSREQITGNYYLPTDADPGAVDGISYNGCAQPLTAEEFLALENLETMFGTITVRFCFEDGTEKTVTLGYNEALTDTDIPALPSRDGCMAYWEGLDLGPLQFDLTAHIAYTSRVTVIQSENTENGHPILLAEGSFTPGAALTMAQTDLAPELEKNQTLLRSLSCSVPESAQPPTLRCRLPESYEEGEISVFLQDADGNWSAVACRVQDSYVVFPAAAGDGQVAVVLTAAFPWMYAAIGAAAVLLLVWIITAAARKKRKKK